MRLFNVCSLIGMIAVGSAYAAPITKKQVVLLCYPSDDLILESCKLFKKQMNDCGHEVIELNDPDANTVAEKLKKLPKATPVFISSHGNSYGEEHYLDSKLGTLDKSKLGPHDPWNIPVGVELAGAIKDKGKVFKTSPILEAAKAHPIVLSACFSGRACQKQPGLNLTASCSYDEVSRSGGEPEAGQEPVLYWIAQLYCDKALFDAVDAKGKQDGNLSKEELSLFLSEKMGGKKILRKIYVGISPNSDPKDIAAVEGFAYFPPKGTKVEVIESESERKTKSEEFIAKQGSKPELKHKILNQRAMYEIVYAANQKITLPGFYSHESLAKAAATKLLKARFPNENLKFQVNKPFTVYMVETEDLTQPCRSLDVAGTQTPSLSTHPIPKPQH